MIIVQDILEELGVTRAHKGYSHTEYALELVLEDEDRLEAVTKESLPGDCQTFSLPLDSGRTQYPDSDSKSMASQSNSASEDGKISVDRGPNDQGFSIDYHGIYSENGLVK